jgi:hypothetical protein
MFSGVALALSELPAELVQQHGLGRRVHDRGGEPGLDCPIAKLSAAWNCLQAALARAPACSANRPGKHPAPTSGGFSNYPLAVLERSPAFSQLKLSTDKR